ncbi:hypothetical protein DTO164E3_752 [Paecilomyces variotii]|uniref:Uncharacterized protein n=1 Tax=Byssochlamys spectabilis TaxID=264951 RepID=A0A443HQI3_BYSSP|nr:hypothetical protein C8Q69DRAFT_508379 [Paecilomyces variotii]KAJ9206511.1 hypothetical protein DTO164E3_752 [Paecilomyces variotii]KAJ9352131.1 hypothetical protein DTO280E4_7884 [Paecilomyces variotii]KAJ9406305.1 hypothetical protein DTO045G8_5941 [Paecilomyces variotii]RWQ94030.1 hypothetical protein C8Q69DRAFT_508379 [Paecilomyces variotii]
MNLRPRFSSDYICKAEIAPDPDISGLGVFSSFIVVTWITIFVAGVPAIYEAVEIFRSDLDLQSFGIIAAKFQKLIGPLCDLQVITGIGIIIASWSQIHTINYYHEQLVVTYWWLTLNSFWAGRVNYLDFDVEDDDIRILQRTWNDSQGPCYRYEDGSTPVPWMIGLCLFCIALLSATFRKTKIFVKWYLDSLEIVNQRLEEWYVTSQQTREKTISQSSGLPAAVPQFGQLKAYFMVALSLTCRVLWFIVVLCLDVWSYGNSFAPMTWCLNAFFSSWDTFIAISTWRLNQTNMKGDESQMSFGQVLPLCLIGSIIFSAVDIFREDPDCEYMTKHDASDVGDCVVENV